MSLFPNDPGDRVREAIDTRARLERAIPSYLADAIRIGREIDREDRLNPVRRAYDQSIARAIAADEARHHPYHTAAERAFYEAVPARTPRAPAVEHTAPAADALARYVITTRPDAAARIAELLAAAPNRNPDPLTNEEHDHGSHEAE
jgi:hypothetical protein